MSEWYTQGKYHREDGPAIFIEEIDKYLHNWDGPAVVLSDGTLEWWYNGKQYNSLEDLQLTVVMET